MISLSYNHAFLLYLGLLLVFLVFLWINSFWKRKHRMGVTPFQKLQHCEYCHHVYLAEAHLTVHQCPCCQSYNK